MKVLITGGAGFLGHHVCEAILRTTNWQIVSLDRLDTSGNLNRLTDLACWEQEKKRVKIVWGDLRAPISTSLAQTIGHVDIILHLAASTHVDRSITDPMSFVMDNMVGTANLLEYTRTVDSLEQMVIFSTDEVFGPSPSDWVQYREWDRHRAGNPYSATKSGAEQLALAYHNTYRLPLFIARSMNIFGERQHIEKMIPLCITKIQREEVMTIHADPTKTHPGVRSYIHARNVAGAILFLLEHAEMGDAYHIVGEREVDNLTLAETISRHLQSPLKFKLVDFHSSRPGHDLAYRLSGEKMAQMGWKLPVGFDDSLRRTIKWYQEHPEWLQ